MTENNSSQEKFNAMFADRDAGLNIGLKLRKLVFDFFDEIEENIVGGAKVKLALYSRGGPNQVLCGIQPAKDGCIFYVHHLKSIDHPRLTFTGKGKHAKQIRFQSADQVLPTDIQWLLERVEQAAPY